MFAVTDPSILMILLTGGFVTPACDLYILSVELKQFIPGVHQKTSLFSITSNVSHSLCHSHTS